MSRLLLPLFALLAAAAAARADEKKADISWAGAAQKLQRATVTVRIWGTEAVKEEKPAPQAADETRKNGKQLPALVTVCSGVCVGPGQVITAAMAGSDSSIRLTMAGGKQSEAKLHVIDEFSGLALLKTDATLTPVELCKSSAVAGEGVLTAAAWGVDPPLVSQGVVAGMNRTRQSAGYPPLVQCDVATMETSSGAGVVDRHGNLAGLIVATDGPDARRGWAYAAPVSHIQRILRLAAQQKGEGVIVLKRRRPVVGMVLDQDEESIVVQRVAAGEAADRAGIKIGDQVVAADGTRIRSVYQAVLPMLSKQPGDVMVFRILRDGTEQDVQVTLGGGVEMSSAPLDLLSGLIQPKVQLARDAQGVITRHDSRDDKSPAIRNVFSPPLLLDEPPPAQPTSSDKIALLEKALDRYRSVIELQQQQLSGEVKRRQEQEKTLETLRAEIETLRRLVTDGEAPK